MDSANPEPTANRLVDRGPWWKAIVDVSALFAVLAATVYAVGLFALWAPLATKVTQDFPTSWYAVSLIPRMAVVGEGIRALLGFPILILLGTLAFPFIPGVFYASMRALGRLTAKLTKKSMPGASLLQSKLTRFDIGETVYGHRDFDDYEEWYQQNKRDLSRAFKQSVVIIAVVLLLTLFFDFLRWDLYVAATVGTIGAMTGYAFVYRSLEWQEKGMPYIVSRRWFLRGLTVLYITAVVNSLVLAVGNEPHLLYVATDFKGASKGRLVTHSDGYWYIFDGKGILRAIPDADAGAVRVSSQPIPNRK